MGSQPYKQKQQWYNVIMSDNKELKEYLEKMERYKEELRENPWLDLRVYVFITTMILVILKACGYITALSWWWITIAIWLPFAIVAAFVGLMMILIVVVFAIFIGCEINDHYKNKREADKNE